jgi:hypothetical protein
LFGKPERKRRLGKSRRRFEVTIKMGEIKIGCQVVNWASVAEVRIPWWSLVDMIMTYRVSL